MEITGVQADGQGEVAGARSGGTRPAEGPDQAAWTVGAASEKMTCLGRAGEGITAGQACSRGQGKFLPGLEGGPIREMW